MNPSVSHGGPACDVPNDGTARAQLLRPKLRSLPWRRLRVALILTLIGVAFSLWLAFRLYSDALEADRQRFDLECEYVASQLEVTMERHEERLCRLANACALDPLMQPSAWAFKMRDAVDVVYNLPAVLQVAYCPKVRKEDYESHRTQAREILGDTYRFDPPPDSAFALPVWMSYTRAEYQPLVAGVDLRQPPHLQRAGLGGARKPGGWVSGPPAFLPRQEGPAQVGFWFVVLLFKPDQPFYPGGQAGWPEAKRLATRDRRNDAYGEATTGLLAAFVSVDRLFNSANGPTRPRNVHVRLYAGKEPQPNLLLNSPGDGPANPRYRRLITQPWYGRSRCLEFTSTPLFEGQSQRYRGWVAAGFGIPLSLLLAGFIGYQAVMRERERAATRELAESRDALRHAQTEREKLSRDLHDGAVQSLYALQLGLLNTARRVEHESPSAAGELAAARANLDAVIAELRQFILHQATREPKTSRTNLADVLHVLAKRPHVHQDTQVEVECAPDAAERVSPRQAVQLANIAREALSNALRHAHASRISLRLRQETAAVRLEVTDNGHGFDPAHARSEGQGLANMRKRAQDEGGLLTINSKPGGGTQLVVTLPVLPDVTVPSDPPIA